jgi:hypothetical protein
VSFASYDDRWLGYNDRDELPEDAPVLCGKHAQPLTRHGCRMCEAEARQTIERREQQAAASDAA